MLHRWKWGLNQKYLVCLTYSINFYYCWPHLPVLFLFKSKTLVFYVSLCCHMDCQEYSLWLIVNQSLRPWLTVVPSAGVCGDSENYLSCWEVLQTGNSTFPLVIGLVSSHNYGGRKSFTVSYIYNNSVTWGWFLRMSHRKYKSKLPWWMKCFPHM